MRKINVYRGIAELLVTIILLWLFPFRIERKLKLLALYVFCQLIVGRFRGKSILVWDEIRLIFLSYASFLFCAALMVPYKAFDWPYQLGTAVLFTACDFVCTLFITRFMHLLYFRKCKEKVLVVGVGDTARRLDEVIGANRFTVLEVQGFVDCNGDPALPSVHQEAKVIDSADKPVISWKNMDEFIFQNDIDTVFVAIPEIDPNEISHLTSIIGQKVKTVKFLPLTNETINYASQIEDFDGLLMISTSQGQMNQLERFAKRTIDILGGLAGSVILLPLIGYVYVLNRKQGDTDPIFFSQDRIGKDGKLFKCYKFRTMIPGAEEMLQELLDSNPEMAEEYRINKKLQEDPRITKAGGFLRKTSLDEFPQFINVLKGDMSLIGPRPYLPEEAPDMGDTYSDIISVRPGITGMWQTHGRSNVTFNYRLKLDEFYCRNWNSWLDMTILIKTVQGLLNGRKDAV